MYWYWCLPTLCRSCSIPSEQSSNKTALYTWWQHAREPLQQPQRRHGFQNAPGWEFKTVFLCTPENFHMTTSGDFQNLLVVVCCRLQQVWFKFKMFSHIKTQLKLKSKADVYIHTHTSADEVRVTQPQGCFEHTQRAGLPWGPEPDRRLCCKVVELRWCRPEEAKAEHQERTEEQLNNNPSRRDRAPGTAAEEKSMSAHSEAQPSTQLHRGSLLQAPVLFLSGGAAGETWALLSSELALIVDSNELYYWSEQEVLLF